MSRPRVRLERCEKVSERVWRLGEEESKHIDVRRCRDGELVDGLLPGRCLVMRLIRNGRELFLEELYALSSAPPAGKVVLLLGMLKSEALESAIRQVTEIGVTEIILVNCRRSVIALNGLRLEQKLARWRRIADEATKQCGAPDPPVIHPPIAVEELSSIALPQRRFVAALSGAKPLSSVEFGGEAALAIGPEGDWAPEELKFMFNLGFEPVSLGPRILRAPTAAAVGCGYLLLSMENKVNASS